MGTSKASALDRKLKLGGIKYYQKTYKGANVSVRCGAYAGPVSVQGSELIGDVAEQCGVSRKPVALEVYDSKTRPGDVVAMPAMSAGEDDLPLEWKRNGRTASLDLGRLLTLKQVVIPDGTRLVIDLYVDRDPDLGQVIGMKLQGAQFVPLTKGTPRKKSGQ